MAAGRVLAGQRRRRDLPRRVPHPRSPGRHAPGRDRGDQRPRRTTCTTRPPVRSPTTTRTWSTGTGSAWDSPSCATTCPATSSRQRRTRRHPHGALRLRHPRARHQTRHPVHRHPHRPARPGRWPAARHDPQVFNGKSLPWITAMSNGSFPLLAGREAPPPRLNAKHSPTVTAAAPSRVATDHPDGAKHTTGAPDGPTGQRPDSTTAS